MRYIDHFSKQSTGYLKYRPTYPDELYAYLASLVVEHELAWDCGTGNGQAAIKLAAYFKHVIATDIHHAQLDAATQLPNIEYRCCPAEKTSIPEASVDLITIAQALHWFKFDDFYQEVRRVSKPDAIIAAWTYSLLSINPDVDVVITKLYSNILGHKYWPKERRYIDDAYQRIPFPFKKLTTPEFKIEKSWNLDELIGFLNTWSALKEYKKQNQQNPIELIYPELCKVWGKAEDKKLVHWPIHLLVGKI